MSYLAYAVRHVQRTIENLIKDHLDSLGWLGSDPPFGASPFIFQRGRMVEADLRAAAGNLVSVSFGSESDDTEEELGGGLLSIEHVAFIDVLGQTDAIALSLASDVKDRLSGRYPDSTRFAAVYSHLTDPPTLVAGYRLEFVDVSREEGNPAVVRNWHIVKATAELTYLGNE